MDHPTAKRLRVHIIDRDPMMRLQIINELGCLTAESPAAFLPSRHFEFWSASDTLPTTGMKFAELVDVAIVDLELIPDNKSIMSALARISQANMLQPLQFIMHGDEWYEFSRRSEFRKLTVHLGCLRGNMDQLRRMLQQLVRTPRP